MESCIAAVALGASCFQQFTSVGVVSFPSAHSVRVEEVHRFWLFAPTSAEMLGLLRSVVAAAGVFGFVFSYFLVWDTLLHVTSPLLSFLRFCLIFLKLQRWFRRCRDAPVSFA